MLFSQQVWILSQRVGIAVFDVLWRIVYLGSDLSHIDKSDVRFSIHSIRSNQTVMLDTAFDFFLASYVVEKSL